MATQVEQTPSLAEIEVAAAQAIEDAVTLDMLPIGSARGRRKTPLVMRVTRELTLADKEMLLNPPKVGLTASPLVKLRATHHALARLMAQGLPQAECSMITGYDPSRISVLKNDPAFQELLEYYKTNVEAKYLDVHERLAALGLSTIDELQDRLDSDPESFSNAELRQLGEMLLDRTVAPAKVQKGGPGQAGGGGQGLPQVVVNFIQSSQPTTGPALELDHRPEPKLIGQSKA